RRSRTKRRTPRGRELAAVSVIVLGEDEDSRRRADPVDEVLVADKNVDQALADLEAQRAVATRFGLLDRMTSPKEDEAIMAADCALRAAPIVMTRIAGDDLPATFSGWTLACAEDHDHGERHIVSVRAAANALPAIVPYLALPRGAAVL